MTYFYLQSFQIVNVMMVEGTLIPGGMKWKRAADDAALNDCGVALSDCP
jgi:hypothetical protein